MEGEKDMEVRYYICKHCGNIVEKVKHKGVPVICCGEPTVVLDEMAAIAGDSVKVTVTVSADEAALPHDCLLYTS